MSSRGADLAGRVRQWRQLGLVLLCMVFARSAAMAFNRWLDQDIDGKNPRTAVREIPAGTISSRAALVFVVLNCLLFVGAAALLNPLCMYLSPVALLVILGYSYTKRFTYLCHFVLGLGLALAPVGSELDHDYLWVYAETAIPDGLSSLTITHDVLRDVWATQSNLVNVERDGRIRSAVFNGSLPEITIDL